MEDVALVAQWLAGEGIVQGNDWIPRTGTGRKHCPVFVSERAQ